MSPHTSLILATALLLGACASASQWDKPGVTPAQLTQDNARCRLIARGITPSGFYAEGSPRFVASAAVGNAIGTAIATSANYQDCMEMQGYTKKQEQ